MVIYLDLVFIINFCYDFLLLMTVDITLKRRTKIYKLIIGALIGSLSLVILFFPLPKFLLFISKIISSIIMVLITYSYKDILYTFNNLLYLYMSSVILGGFLYLLDLEFSYKNEGLIFYFDGISINYIILLIIAPLILGLYIYQNKRIKKLYNYNYKVKIIFKNNKEIECNALLDSGNKLRDPITKKYIIMVEKGFLKDNIRSPIYVPYKALNKTGILSCISIKYIEINNKIFTNYLVGISNDTFNIEGINCILNNKLLEDL
ncbi:MAG: sigma-E processing peptidase SpoIIGA [Bacilli bacterium]